MSGGRVPPALSPGKRHSRNASHLEHLKKVQINGGGRGGGGGGRGGGGGGGGPARSHENVFASLRATSMVTSKPLLPAELIATIVDYVPVDDLLRLARVSHRLQEMVYDDTRWIQKLKAMGAWNEAEARQAGVEEARRRRTDAEAEADADADGPLASRATTEGFEQQRDAHDALHVFQRARSVRGLGRQEFGKIYRALGPIYFDLAQSRGHADALLFRTYRDPEQQARVLGNLKRFAQCDTGAGWQQREARLDDMIGVFEHAVLREFEQAAAAGDTAGRMHRYAHVLVTLNGGGAAVDSFISNHPVMTRAMRLPAPEDCLQGCAPGHVDLDSSQSVFQQLAGVLVGQAEVIDHVFPAAVDVLTPFLTRVCDQILSDYLTALFDQAHATDRETYVKAVAGTLGQAFRLAASLQPTKASPPDFRKAAEQTLVRCFGKHVGLYLAAEFQVFRTKAETRVTRWEKELSEQEASTEAFFMSNLNRQAAKRDFLTSFKKVVMMPVNVIGAPFASAKPAESVATRSSANLNAIPTSHTGGGRPGTPTVSGAGTPAGRPGTPAQEAPTSELAAKTAILNSRLEGIKSLFSIEVALDLTHLAKASIERTSLVVQVGGEDGEEAIKQCTSIFTTMLDILGNRHIKNGFDRAVGHLGQYNPREVRKFKQDRRGPDSPTAGDAAHVGVEPLVTFLELVNVGDLIQQMVDVFYSQELVATKLLDPDDFLNPAVKDKKKFEQMLDERVAAGLNKGIDVLMDEVEYICATTQTPTDFNPGPQGIVEVGPSATAKQIVDMVSGHTAMLLGSTDKNVLDVFNQEVGLRLFAALCKHFKRQRISVDGAITLISDINHYHSYVSTLRQKSLLSYYEALREMSQIYLVSIEPPASYFGGPKNQRASLLLSTKESATAKQAKELATIIADSPRYHSIFPTEEVYEFAQRRADWYLVKAYVESAMYGVGCSLM